MAKSLETRIARLEELAQEQRVRQMYAEIAREYDMDPDELWREGEAFLTLPLAEQLAEIDRIAAESEAQGEPWLDAEAIKATLTREYKP